MHDHYAAALLAEMDIGEMNEYDGHIVPMNKPALKYHAEARSGNVIAPPYAFRIQTELLTS
jgi:hypothetical protein